MSSIVVFGSGAWGTALASTWARAGLSVALWAYPEDEGAEMARLRAHPRLQGGRLPDSLRVATKLCGDFDSAIWVSAMPTQITPAVWEGLLKKMDARPKAFIHVSKGILQDRHELLSQTLAPVLGLPIGAMSGPTFADEVFLEKPSAIVLALPESIPCEKARRLQALLSTPRFRVYLSRDVAGVELCGALKNVLAIAGGVLEALNLGLNSRAALLTRGLAEMSRLVYRLGGKPETVMGLAGMGDLMLTATGPQSRNRTFGEKIGSGMNTQEAMQSMGGAVVVEGVHTARAAMELARDVGIEMPITQEVIRLLDGGSPHESVDNLMRRELKGEWDSHS